MSHLQVNARRINDEVNVFDGILSNRFFLVILLSEALLQVTLISKQSSHLRHVYIPTQM